MARSFICGMVLMLGAAVLIVGGFLGVRAIQASEQGLRPSVRAEEAAETYRDRIEATYRLLGKGELVSDEYSGM